MPIPRFRIRTLMTAGVMVAVVGSFCGLLAGILAPTVVIGLYALDGPEPDATFSPAGWAAWRGLLIGVSLGGVIGFLVCLVSRWPRMTTRSWMVAVAIVAVLFAGGLTIYRRSARFQALAEHHGSKAGVLQLTPTSKGGPAGEIRILGINDVPINRKLADWHLELRNKYRSAARRPWLPVPPDPPPPE